MRGFLYVHQYNITNVLVKVCHTVPFRLRVFRDSHKSGNVFYEKYMENNQRHLRMILGFSKRICFFSWLSTFVTCDLLWWQWNKFNQIVHDCYSTKFQKTIIDKWLTFITFLTVNTKQTAIDAVVDNNWIAIFAILYSRYSIALLLAQRHAICGDIIPRWYSHPHFSSTPPLLYRV